jgi:hypothetical protein
LIEPTKSSTSLNASDFRRIFLVRVHRLLYLGYKRLDIRTYANAEEPDITGDLRGAMEAVIDDPNAVDWLHLFYVEDEHHVNDAKRKGKRRKRVDIRVTASRPRPRNHFSIEAKRLSAKCPIGDYMGSEGLGCFLSGDYAAAEDDAGMLGYIQSKTIDEWAAALKELLDGEAATYQVSDGIAWAEHRFKGGPPMTFHSRHLRKTVGRPIDIFHNLLVFFG